ncbi:MAG: MFS transporter, partial [Mesorhizobium sp.]
MTVLTPALPAQAVAEIETRRTAYSKVFWRIVPFLMLCYVVAYLDRVNIGFAKLQMSADLGFSETVYGLGAGIFFIGYFLFEVPSNVILHKVGARMWIARIMITWGLISAGFMFVTSAPTFYLLRFLLGVAEAGFYPGIILFLTYWYPSHRRAKIIAVFMSAIPVSGILGNPLSGWIMDSFDGAHGLAGWQWMFLIEAVPAVLLGIAVLFFLDNGIRQAKWLSETEKQALEEEIAREERHKESGHSVAGIFRDRRVWLMCLIYFTFVMGQYGLTFWMPTLVKATGITGNFNIGLISAIPFICAVVVMNLFGRSADRHRERRWHLVVPALLGA